MLRLSMAFAAAGAVSLGAGILTLATVRAASPSNPPSTEPAKPLPALKTSGNKILNVNNEPVRLRGVNCASMEYTSDGQGHILQSIAAAIDVWKANCIRLPLSQDRWFGKVDREQPNGPNAYRELVDQCVKLCMAKNCYIILDLHWNDLEEWGQNIGQHSLPDRYSIEFWKDFAKVYANNPNVIFDLYNEPHDVTWDVWLNGGDITDKPNTRGAVAKPYHAIGMQDMLDAVRSTGARNMVLVGGLDWSYQFAGILDGRQLKDKQGLGIAYADHVYNNKNETAYKWADDLDRAAKVLPIIVSEFGIMANGGGVPRGNRRGGAAPGAPGAFPGTAPGATLPARGPGGAGRGPDRTDPGNGDDWLKHVIQIIEDRQYSYTAWDFHINSGPTLISDWNYTPTQPFGTLVKTQLAGTWTKYIIPPLPVLTLPATEPRATPVLPAPSPAQ